MWKWVPRWCRFCGDTHPPSPGAAPPGRGALPAEPQLDPALNDQPSCRIPGGLGCQVLWKPILFWLSQRNVPSPSPDPGHGGTFLKILSRVQSKQRGMAWVLDSWLRNQQGDWEKKKNQEFVPHPHAQKERQVTSRRGGTVGRLAGGDSCPRTLLSFSVCLRGDGSLSDLVCLTVPKCATRSIICGGWFCGEKDLFNFSWLPCTKSVRKENVKYEISNKTKTAL